jgi:hypothetical protein
MNNAMSPKSRQVLAIARVSRCDADASKKSDPGASFTSSDHKRRIQVMVGKGLMEVVTVGKFAGLKEVNAKLTTAGIDLLNTIHGAKCHHCGHEHY